MLFCIFQGNKSLESPNCYILVFNLSTNRRFSLSLHFSVLSQSLSLRLWTLCLSLAEEQGIVDLFLSLSLCLSRLTISFDVFLSLLICLCLSLSTLSVSVSLDLCLCFFFCLCRYTSMSLSNSVYFDSVCLFVEFS